MQDCDMTGRCWGRKEPLLATHIPRRHIMTVAYLIAIAACLGSCGAKERARPWRQCPRRSS